MDGLTKRVARQIIDRVSGPGQPPDYGFQYFSAGLGPYLSIIEDEYLRDFIREGGSSFKMVVGLYGGGKTHLLYSVRELAWKNNFVTSYIELRQNSTPLHKLELVYASIVQRVAVPQPPEEILGGQSHGIESLLRSALQVQRDRLREAGVPAADVDGEIHAWIEGFSRLDSVSFQKAIRAAFAALLEDREDEFETICQWLRGEGYVRSVHGKYGILQKIDTSTAFSMMRSLLQVVRDLGYKLPRSKLHGFTLPTGVGAYKSGQFIPGTLVYTRVPYLVALVLGIIPSAFRMSGNFYIFYPAKRLTLVYTRAARCTCQRAQPLLSKRECLFAPARLYIFKCHPYKIFLLVRIL